MRSCVLLLALASCVDVADEHRCSVDDHCPDPGRCELPAGNCSLPDPSCGSAGSRYDELAGQRANVCIVSTEVAGEIVEVTPIALVDHSDQITASCNPIVGGREGYVEIRNPTPQMVFFDTGGAGTNTHVALSVRTGSCPGLTEVPGTCAGPGCDQQLYSQLIAVLPPATYCLVAEQLDESEESGMVGIRVIAMLGAAPALASGFASPVEDSCPQLAGPSTTCGDDLAPTAAYVFALCPRPYSLTLAVDPDDAGSLDATVQIRELTPVGADVFPCRDDQPVDQPESFAPPSSMLVGPGPYWILVKGTAPGQCGQYAMSFTVAPL